MVGSAKKLSPGYHAMQNHKSVSLFQDSFRISEQTYDATWCNIP